MKKILGKFDCSTGDKTIIKVRGDLIIRTAISKDQNYIDKQQKENSFAVGFIQKTIWDKYVFGGQRNFVVFICEKNGDQVGYVLLTPGKKVGDYAKIQQIVIQQDARRLEYGTLLIDAVREFCEEIGRIGTTLRCRKDLESNKFWEALGFTLYGVWEKGKFNHVGFKASNDIFLWRIELNRKTPTLFYGVEIEYPDREIITGIY
jgi:GNAT superfamily N-acetyltransferase